MNWRCDICDKVFYDEFRNNHLQSGFHEGLANSIIRKNNITNPKPVKNDDTIRNSLRSHYKKDEKFQVIFFGEIINTIETN